MDKISSIQLPNIPSLLNLNKGNVAENVVYILLFGAILSYLLFNILKHGKGIFVYGLQKLDDYVIYYDLEKENFTVSLPSTPELKVNNSSFGSSIYFKVDEKERDIEGYICNIKNTTNADEPLTIKVLPRNSKDNFNIIYEEIKFNEETDVYQVHIKPFTKATKDGKSILGVTSNPVYVFSKAADEGPMIKNTISVSKSLDDLNFMT